MDECCKGKGNYNQLAGRQAYQKELQTEPWLLLVSRSDAFEHLQMFRTHVSRNLCLEILEHARFIPQLTVYCILTNMHSSAVQVNHDDTSVQRASQPLTRTMVH